MKRVLLILALLLVVAGLFFSGLGRYLTIATLQSEQMRLAALVHAAPLSASLLFFMLYIFVTGLSLPGALVLTLAGGALFGFWWGLLLVSFASSIGALFSFLLSRYLLRDWLQQKFSGAFREMDRGFKRDGDQYLVLMRLVPVFPFFLVNLLSGLSSIGAARFYLLSQLAMLPGTAVYVNAGTELAKIQKVSDIASPSLLLAFSLLGLFPLVVKKLAQRWRKRRHVDSLTKV